MMSNESRPVMLTAQQIRILQDLILEKQYQLAATQSENQQAIDYSHLSEQMSHTTDLLMQLTDALSENCQIPIHETPEIPASTCP
jgi:hypothetical protein